MLLDIVLLPPAGIRKKIGTKIKKETKGQPSHFIVDGVKLLPHLSLWHMNTASGKIDKIADDLKEVIKGQKPIKIKSGTFKTEERYPGYIGFSVKENKNLEEFRDKIFQKIYSYKTGTMPPFASFLKIKHTKAEVAEIQKYGKRIGFRPHFTGAWLKNPESVEQVMRQMQKVKFSFAAKEIYICEVDKWWQVKRIIKKIKFA